ncbi:MAG: retropepsin-like domain-containing protein [Reichenbachiella sp.]
MKYPILIIVCTFAFQIKAQLIEHIPIKNLSSKPIIQVTVNGKKCNFLVDTGADISIFNTSRLKKFHLEASKIYGKHLAIGAHGHTTEVVKVSNVKISLTENIHLSEIYGMNIDKVSMSIHEKTSIRVDGILGSDMLIKYRGIIDYHSRQITLIDNKWKKELAMK